MYLVAEPMSRVGEMDNKAISASNLKLKLTEAELGKKEQVAAGKMA